MHLYIDPNKNVATLVHGGSMKIGTLEFETFSIDDKDKKKDILDIVFYSDDLRTNLSIKDYLKKLLTTLFEEQDGFSGKRPFGNSCWDYNLYHALFKNGLIDGEEEIDEDGEVLEVNYDVDEGYKLIIAAINRL